MPKGIILKVVGGIFYIKTSIKTTSFMSIFKLRVKQCFLLFLNKKVAIYNKIVV